jgi:hypothetical protein
VPFSECIKLRFKLTLKCLIASSPIIAYLLFNNALKNYLRHFVRLFSNKMKLGLALKLGLIGTALARVSPRSSFARTAKADSI